MGHLVLLYTPTVSCTVHSPGTGCYNPCRIISLLGITHPVKGSLFQVQGVFGKMAPTRDLFQEESQIVALVDIFCKTCIKTLNFDICFD